MIPAAPVSGYSPKKILRMQLHQNFAPKMVLKSTVVWLPPT